MLIKLAILFLASLALGLITHSVRELSRVHRSRNGNSIEGVSPNERYGLRAIAGVLLGVLAFFGWRWVTARPNTPRRRA
jgi:hypothetical protein